MPFDVPTLLVLRRFAQRQQAARAVRQAPLAALRSSPVHQTLSQPQPHPAALAPPGHPASAPIAAAPHLAGIKVSVPVASDAGVKHPTPQEVAQQMVQKSIDEAKAILAQMAAKAAAYLKAHPRPGATAQPSDIAAWLKAGGFSPRAMFPEWQWTVIKKTPTTGLGAIFGNLSAITGEVLEPGEAIAVVQLGSNDVVTWYDHPSGAWSYYHHWGQDIGQVLASMGSTIANAISDATKALSSAVSAVTSVVGTVLQYAQIAASLVPGLGQVVNEVVSVAEAALDALSGMSALAIAFDSAYHAILASVPGLEALAPALGPIVDFLKNLISKGVKGMVASEVHSALGAALKQVPDAPSVGAYSPRSIAASLAGWVLSKLGVPA